jgi:subtilisin family serine protease
VDAFKANDRAEAYDLVRAIDLLAGRSVNVINMSLSGPDNALLARLVSTLGEKHVEIVAAAGNDGPSAKAAYPAAYENVIAVTAVDRRKRAYRRANQGDYVDIAAPGVGVWAAASIKGTRPKTGTSFAAPFVAAATALVKSRAPGQVPAIEILRKDAEDLGQPGKDPVFGWGLLNAENLCETE